jgi:ADP-ribosyl-[dinitrogen reductase] hydrolase
MIGLAVGDALGAPVEFKDKGTFPYISDMIAGGAFQLNKGEWTDDTSMALCLLDSLISVGFDLNDQADRYIKWYKQGYFSVKGYCFDIGCNTRKSLENYIKTGNIVSPFVDSCGNGAIMRLAPITLYTAFMKDVDIVKYSGETSKVTHNSLLSIEACRFMSLLISRLINGYSKNEALNSIDTEFKTEIKDFLSLEYIVNKDTLNNSGYVVDSLKLALWGFYTTNNFKDGLLKVVNWGGDSDTNGAIYGQIAGAYYGLDGIPDNWKKVLYKKDMIKVMILKLIEKM